MLNLKRKEKPENGKKTQHTAKPRGAFVEKWRGLSLRWKLFSGFGAVIGIFIISVVITAILVGSIRSNAKSQADHMDDLDNIVQLQNGVAAMYADQADVIINAKGEAVKSFKESAVLFKERIGKIDAHTPDSVKVVDELRTAADGFIANFDKVAEIYEKRDTMLEQTVRNEYTQLDQKTDTFKTTMNSALDKLRAAYGKDLEKANSTMFTSIGTTLIVTLVLCAAALAAGLLMSYLMARMIVGPVARMAEAAERVADGDLTVRLESGSKDELGRLNDSFARMVANLKEIIASVKTSATQVTEASDQLKSAAEQAGEASQFIASTIEETASGAETQQTATGETARAMDEMAGGIQRIAETASSVSELSAETVTQAESGYGTVSEVITQMDTATDALGHAAGVIRRLEERSREIGTIASAIKEIAEQTNLLALNAAIEAARAGEHGRGFAVVADEVRKLAESSNTSASEIGKIIRAIGEDTQLAVEAMNMGSGEAEKSLATARAAGDTFREIVGAIGNVADQIQEMSAVAEQMSAGTQEVTASVAELARIAKNTAAGTQNVAASTEEQLASLAEMAKSAEGLQTMAVALETVVGRFKL